jgi:hypothetical protein
VFVVYAPESRRIFSTVAIPDTGLVKIISDFWSGYSAGFANSASPNSSGLEIAARVTANKVSIRFFRWLNIFNSLSTAYDMTGIRKISKIA